MLNPFGLVPLSCKPDDACQAQAPPHIIQSLTDPECQNAGGAMPGHFQFGQGSGCWERSGGAAGQFGHGQASMAVRLWATHLDMRDELT